MISYKINLVKRKKCPLCDSVYKLVCSHRADSNILEKYFLNKYNCKINMINDYEIAKCNNCYFLFQVHIPDNNSIKILYETIINYKMSLRKRLRASNGYFKLLYEDLIRLMLIFNKYLRPNEIKVLDFGLGWSNWAKLAQSSGYKVFGCEISEKRKKYSEKYGIKCRDLDDFPNEYFNYINTDEVLEHVENPNDLISKLKLKLCYGGVIKIFVPNCNLFFLLKSKKKIYKELAPLEHINGFTKKSLDKFMQNKGFKRLSPLIFLLNWKTFLFGIKQIFNTRGYFVKIK